MSRDEIFARVKHYMVNLFDTDEKLITLDASLQKDLDLDSIDAIDLIAKLQELTGQKIKPEEFKTVRTVGDIVDRIYDLVNAQNS